MRTYCVKKVISLSVWILALQVAYDKDNLLYSALVLK